MNIAINTSLFVFIFLFVITLAGILFKLNNLKHYRSEFDSKLTLLEGYFFGKLPTVSKTTDFKFPEDSQTGKLERQLDQSSNNLNTITNKLMYRLGAYDMIDLNNRLNNQSIGLVVQLVALNLALVLVAFANGNLFPTISSPVVPGAMCVGGVFTLYVCVKKMRLMFKVEHILESVRQRDFP